MITTHTIAGIVAIVTIKLLEYVFLYIYITDNMKPNISELTTQIIKSATGITPAVSASNNPLNRFSAILITSLHLLIYAQIGF